MRRTACAAPERGPALRRPALAQPARVGWLPAAGPAAPTPDRAALAAQELAARKSIVANPVKMLEIKAQVGGEGTFFVYSL